MNSTHDWSINSKYNNCYSYAFNDYNKHATEKRVPGNIDTPYTCSKLINGIQQDYPNTQMISKSEHCPNGFYKVYLAVDEVSDDFHFWRQDHENTWTHKLGSNLPSTVDSNGHAIKDPEMSNRSFKKYQYDTSCAYFCVKNH